jgi:hypothetical protein
MFEYSEYIIQPGETGETITKAMTDAGWEVYLTVRFGEDKTLKSITFRRLSQ